MDRNEDALCHISGKEPTLSTRRRIAAYFAAVGPARKACCNRVTSFVGVMRRRAGALVTV